MSLTATYSADVSRVRLTAADLDPAAVSADLARTVDGIRWADVRGGQSAAVAAGALVLPVDDYEFAADVPNTYRITTYDAGGATLATETTTVTPDLEGVPWLKVIARPFLNRPVTVQDYGEIKRAARSGVFEIVGASRPVVVTDLRGSSTFDLSLITESATAAETMRYALATGDVVFLHVPADCDVPGGYYAAGDVTEARGSRRSVRRLFSFPVTEVDAPAATIVGSTATWQTVINTYATWSDVLAAQATWAELLELIGAPGDVITS